jgi:sugar/nucleoside kinase (ribokinase family)
VQFVEEHIGEYTTVLSNDPAGVQAPPDVVVVGAASRDLVDDDPRGWRLGGAVSYAALAIARLGLRVGALVGADAEAATASELDVLREAGADVRVVPLASGPVFDNIEEPTGRRQIAHAVADPLPLAALPGHWQDAAAWILGPVAGELENGWAAVPRDDALVAIGWQGLLRTVRAGQPVRRVAPSASPLLARADLVALSATDLGPDTRIDQLCGWLRPGATLLVTSGVDGGLAAEVGPEGPRRLYRYPALAPDRVVDPTGAGDVFLAAVLAARAQPNLVGGRIAQRLDLLLGAAAASLLVEGPGLAGVPTREAVRRRMAEASWRRPGGEDEGRVG